eukprot:comp17843_c1_seq2/m.18004 comp17843_c1_seq2/g.18004  ORF comp17843_c1_seq2/g.18004 comp17843_c1_seq2/m.18004 type:complete len:136 (-) comp17843_c1_seq2:285-692(-)
MRDKAAFVLSPHNMTDIAVSQPFYMTQREMGLLSDHIHHAPLVQENDFTARKYRKAIAQNPRTAKDMVPESSLSAQASSDDDDEPVIYDSHVACDGGHCTAVSKQKDGKGGRQEEGLCRNPMCKVRVSMPLTVWL